MKKHKKEKPIVKKDPTYRYQENNSTRGILLLIIGSSRGGRGGGRGGRGGRYSGRGWINLILGIPHGGEKSIAEAAVPAEPQDTWGIDTEATIANTDDWNQTAQKASDQEWTKVTEINDLEKETEKLSIKKGITVVKANGKTSKKTTNWASIVKG